MWKWGWHRDIGVKSWLHYESFAIDAIVDRIQPSSFRARSNDQVNEKTPIVFGGSWIMPWERDLFSHIHSTGCQHSYSSPGKKHWMSFIQKQKRRDGTGWQTRQKEGRQSKTNPASDRVAQVNTLHPVKEDWVSYSRSEIFPKPGLNPQIVQKTFHLARHPITNLFYILGTSGGWLSVHFLPTYTHTPLLCQVRGKKIRVCSHLPSDLQSNLIPVQVFHVL